MRHLHLTTIATLLLLFVLYAGSGYAVPQLLTFEEPGWGLTNADLVGQDWSAITANGVMLDRYPGRGALRSGIRTVGHNTEAFMFGVNGITGPPTGIPGVPPPPWAPVMNTGSFLYNSYGSGDAIAGLSTAPMGMNFVDPTSGQFRAGGTHVTSIDFGRAVGSNAAAPSLAIVGFRAAPAGGFVQTFFLPPVAIGFGATTTVDLSTQVPVDRIEIRRAPGFQNLGGYAMDTLIWDDGLQPFAPSAATTSNEPFQAMLEGTHAGSSPSNSVGAPGTLLLVGLGLPWLGQRVRRRTKTLP